MSKNIHLFVNLAIRLLMVIIYVLFNFNHLLHNSQNIFSSFFTNILYSFGWFRCHQIQLSHDVIFCKFIYRIYYIWPISGKPKRTVGHLIKIQMFWDAIVANQSDSTKMRIARITLVALAFNTIGEFAWHRRDADVMRTICGKSIYFHYNNVQGCQQIKTFVCYP